ncbi:hypothetical protein FRC12_013723 [Ceratobasidium sp. 428]|nr:hypothetical protein FRC12_013723 [Ceratobasidium sp. 428]
MQLVHAELGPTMGRELKNTFPTVYGKPDFDFKPWMPPQHPINSQEAFMAVTYCDLLAGELECRCDEFDNV